MTPGLTRVARIRALARECGAAVLLTMSVLTALPDPRIETPPAIVRMARQGVGEFDEREWVGTTTLLTVPLMSAEEDRPAVVYGPLLRERLN